MLLEIDLQMFLENNVKELGYNDIAWTFKSDYSCQDHVIDVIVINVLEMFYDLNKLKIEKLGLFLHYLHN